MQQTAGNNEMLMESSRNIHGMPQQLTRSQCSNDRNAKVPFQSI